MAEQKPMIVIKKITVVAGGGHGGAWKVAFADFMTAMMAFFLVMWLLATSSEAQKAAIADHFSTPSVIEYQFNNYGAELTLEKLFLDLVNEPLKVFQDLVAPIDKTPNILSFGMKKMVMAHMAEELGELASNVEVSGDTVTFEVPDHYLFEKRSARPSGQFADVMEKVKGITEGLEDAELHITSVVYTGKIDEEQKAAAKNVAQERLDLVQQKVKSTLQNPTVDVFGKMAVKQDDRPMEQKKKGPGVIRFEIKQKETLSDGTKPKPLRDGLFSGETSENDSVYNNFVSKVSRTSKK